jgi:hypothetical protein
MLIGQCAGSQAGNFGMPWFSSQSMRLLSRAYMQVSAILQQGGPLGYPALV